MAKRSTSIVAAAVIAAGLLFTAAAPAGAIDISTAQKVRVTDQPDGHFGAVTRVNLGAGDAKSVYIKAKSLVDQDVDAWLDDVFPPAGITLKYFTKSGKNITDELTGANKYEFTLRPDKPKVFRVKIKAEIDGLEACLVHESYDDTGYAFARTALNRPKSECT